MKLTVILDEVWTDEDWNRSVAEIIREEIQAAIRKEVKILVKAYIADRRNSVVKKADIEARQLLKGVL